MPRWHLLEIEDQPWCPRIVRRGAVAYLTVLGAVSRSALRAFATALGEGMRAAGTTQIVDLCSGAAGPLPVLLRELRALGIPARARLTDRYPDHREMAELVSRHPTWLSADGDPIDARAVPRDRVGFRLLCSSFHHFRPTDAEAILADAVAAGTGIAIYELPERRWLTLLAAAASVVLVPLAWPISGPWRWDSFALTCIVPVVPVVAAFDGVVSTLRAYTTAELRQLTERADPEGRFVWRVERTPYLGVFGATWLVGAPAASPRGDATTRGPSGSGRRTW